MTYPDVSMIAFAFVGGLFSTLLMTITEIPSWKRWGIEGVLEWHENQMISEKFFKLPKFILHLKGIFFLHFLNGGLGGWGFCYCC